MRRKRIVLAVIVLAIIVALVLLFSGGRSREPAGGSWRPPAVA